MQNTTAHFLAVLLLLLVGAELTKGYDVTTTNSSSSITNGGDDVQPWTLFNNPTFPRYPAVYAHTMRVVVSPLTKTPLVSIICMSADYKQTAVCYRPMNAHFQYTDSEKILFEGSGDGRLTSFSTSHLGLKPGYVAFWGTSHGISGRYVGPDGEELPTAPVRVNSDAAPDFVANPVGDGKVVLLYPTASSKWALRLVEVQGQTISVGNTESPATHKCESTCKCQYASMAATTAGRGFVVYTTECHRDKVYVVPFFSAAGSSTIELGGEVSLTLSTEVPVIARAAALNDHLGVFTRTANRVTHVCLVNLKTGAQVGTPLRLSLPEGAVFSEAGGISSSNNNGTTTQTLLINDDYGHSTVISVVTDASSNKSTSADPTMSVESPTLLSPPRIPEDIAYYTRHTHIANNTFFTQIVSRKQNVYTRVNTVRGLVKEYLEGPPPSPPPSPPPQTDVRPPPTTLQPPTTDQVDPTDIIVAVTVSLVALGAGVVIISSYCREEKEGAQDATSGSGSAPPRGVPVLATPNKNAPPGTCDTKGGCTTSVGSNGKGVKKGSDYSTNHGESGHENNGAVELDPIRTTTPTATATLSNKNGVSDDEDDDAVHLCVVCLSAPKRMVFVPCGHMCCCEHCGESLDVCPVCRGVITFKQKVFK